MLQRNRRLRPIGPSEVEEVIVYDRSVLAGLEYYLSGEAATRGLAGRLLTG